ncbi:MAG TPA: UbiD family decarboxylase [Burkholderiales bacterium]|nr:UbiD family decarboxylase [Burkholderiales bacterium]
MKPETPPALDTSFRAALARMRAAGRLRTLGREADPDLEIASIMKKLDGAHALVFPSVRGHGVPVIGNLLGSQANCEAAFGAGFREIRGFVARGLGNPIPPERVSQAPCQARVHRQGFDIGKMFPVLRHTEADSGRFITAGIAIVQDPETGVYNASYHRLQLLGPNRTAVKLDYGRHLRAAFERAQRMKKDLPVAFVLGTDLAVQYTAATMGAQMPESADELAVAGGVRGSPLPVARCVTQDLWIPAESEIVLEGVMRHAGTVREGPFGEFIGYLSPQGDAPVFEISAVTHREHPVYPAINGYGRETVMLRKYVMEASPLKALQASVPIIQDAEMTAGGLHRFIAVLGVKKTSPQHDGLQRNAILAAFATLKDLDLVIAVDDDIDIRDPVDVEYALATRMEASRDVFVIPQARGHEYVRAGDGGIVAKMGIDATVPFEQRSRFARVRFKDVSTTEKDFNSDVSAIPWLT